MATLSTDQLSAIRATLNDERSTIMESTRLLAGDDAALAAARASGEAKSGGEGEGDNLSVDRHLVSMLGETARAAISEIDAALDRLNAGTYGDCHRCGAPIPPERLEVRPRTTICVPCARRQSRS